MKSSPPKVSVIVPVYNVERYLRRCMDSLIAQTLRDIEIICVDDGSPDRSLEILKEYAARDDRVKIVRRPNGGLSAARNTGMDHAAAPYFMFCDSDDWVEPSWCEELYGAIERSGADFAVARAFIDGDCEKERRDLLERNQTLRFPEGKNDVELQMFTRIDHALWIRIFRRSLIERHGLRFPEGTVCEDWPFCQEYLFVSSKVYFLDRLLYHYFQRRGSILNGGVKAAQRELDFLSHWGRLCRFLKDDGRWDAWKGKLLDVLPYMVGGTADRNPTVRERVYEMADSFLEAIPAADFDGLCDETTRGIRMIRNRTAHQLKSVRWKIGPLTVGKLKCTPWERKIYILGIRIYRKRFS